VPDPAHGTQADFDEVFATLQRRTLAFLKAPDLTTADIHAIGTL
jgi:hypothetical protein